MGGGGRPTRNVVLYFTNIFLILQDPTEEGVVPAKRCKLDSLKRPAYEPAGNQAKKRPCHTREEDENISVLLSGEEDDENLVSSQTMYL